MHMRRLVFACALFGLLALPASAFGSTRAAGDGTFVAKNASGVIQIVATGAFFGRCDTCKVWISDPNPDDGPGPKLSNVDFRRDPVGPGTIWGGADLRFRLIGGFFRLRVSGYGIDLSAVGHGSGNIVGAGTLDDGTYSLNGGDFKSVQDDIFSFKLLAPASG
jgi:hypothetical protein